MTENTINQESMLRVGTILHGTYRIDRYLSSGGFGNTYVATHVDFDETRAVKEFFMKGVTQRDGNNTTVSVSNREKVQEFQGQREKFKKEARRLRKLNNQHIVRVHDLFEENGTAYYVMDYIDGENLKEKLARSKKPLSESEVESFIPQILDALSEVHANNIWHLDLKPANIMVDRHGVVKLIDFGASKQFDVQKGGATTGTAISYTQGFAPREQMEQRYEKFGPWTDFYALGATIYNLLTKQRPPMPTDIDDDRSEDKHLALPLPAEVSKRMRQLILWLMKTDRLERPSSVKEIQDFINKKEDDDVTVVEAPHKKEQPKTPVEPKTPTSEKKPQTGNSSRKKGNSMKKLILAASSIVILAVGGYFLLNTSGSQEQEKPMKEKLEKVLPMTVTNKVLTIPGGECTYTGQVNAQGVPHGKGEAWFKDEDRRHYRGQFVNGNMHGENAFFQYQKAGDTFEGSFDNNMFNRGRYTIKETGEYFEGSFSNGKPFHGKWYDKKGKVMETI